MKYRREPFELALPDDSVRSEGAHVSDIIKYMLVHIDQRTYGAPITQATRNYWEVGFAWEAAVARELAARRWRNRHTITPGIELERDAVFGTLDAFDLAAWEVLEMKLSKLHADKTIIDTKMRHYVWQVKAYCHMADTDRASVYISHVNGNYRDQSLLLYRWRLRFSDRELVNNWRMLISNRDRMLEDKPWQKQRQEQRQRELARRTSTSSERVS